MKKTYETICENWGIEEYRHRRDFEWLKEDKRDESGKLTRELGIRKQGGRVERLKRKHTRVGTHLYTENDELWTGKVSVSAMDFVF